MNLAGMTVQPFLLSAEHAFTLDPQELAPSLTGGELVVIGSPNNPTGALVDPEQIIVLAKSHPDSLFLVDEAFLKFVEGGRSVAFVADNILTLHSLTKFYAIPGLRLGFGIFPLPIARLLRAHLPPWTVNTLAQAVGIRALADLEYGAQSRPLCAELRTALHDELKRIPALQVFDSAANYLMLRLVDGSDACILAGKLLARKIMIRTCANYVGLDTSYFRIAVRTEPENRLLLEALTELLQPQPQKVVKSRLKTARPLMFQGTSSNAGKSVLTAALCRILLQDGVRVAPFKAQNMSLNSFVTRDGLEMGRAQVVQAQAARLDPDVRMNPVLLKPNSDTGSQVIIKGRPVGNMDVMTYLRYKESAMQAAHAAYDSLAAEYDVILLEGAGSPGEVNLKRHDIVNMGMARYAQAPVLLVGDIDRGGVYASFVGTMEVLNEWERALVAGFVVNRFRGQASLLQAAHDYVLAHTGRDVLEWCPI